MNNFKILKRDIVTRGRRGVLYTPHGPIQTPAFMPIGTAGSVKGLTPEQVERTGTEIILANTYHLVIRPGVDAVESLGGLHKLTAWDKPILTDSGGYQVFSLSKLTKLDDDGAEFASHVDGARVRLNPEIATNAQNRLGADIIMCFDQCTPFPCETAELKKAVERTVCWARRCKNTHANPKQMLFGIVQGGIDLSRRQYCAEELVKLDFDGYALGGLSVGEGYQNMVKTVAHTTGFLPDDKPRYLMGAGTPSDIIAAVREGVDMFDCVLPTRNGRNAFAFTEDGPLRLRNSFHSSDDGPVEAACDCYCCRNFTRGAIRHFFNVGEMLGPILLSIHNITFYQRLMTQIRAGIENSDFAHWAQEKLQKYEKTGFTKNVENSVNSL
jgi:queuine tRNA-ribosyltransferase